MQLHAVHLRKPEQNKLLFNEGTGYTRIDEEMVNNLNVAAEYIEYKKSRKTDAYKQLFNRSRYIRRSSYLKTLKMTLIPLPVAFLYSFTVDTAICATSLCGKPNTPVEIQQNAILSQPFSSASFRQE